ncbi:hypothetical protein SAMN05880501_11595 [Ureibacillus xyleni]|uniref:Uncharacterized protein n=1 Tax=Ureibacillus xyleni TaxID=614648 RepID=A0A285TLE1_9BACL|nr:hypothetical protein [Ureibacillus xyleni]SOC23512.1 hypothetical protein SAMN05880501_11595 [Ureibacillus xyleni]
MLQFVISKEKYSLCLVNPSKEDVQDVYLKYFGHRVDRNIYYEFEPIQMYIDTLYGESYAILEESNSSNLDTTFQYEVLFVREEGVVFKKFLRKKLENIITLDSHPLFTTSVWKIEETTSEYIDVEDIIQIVAHDIYASKAPIQDNIYQQLIRRSDLFEEFFDNLYLEMDSYYRGEKCNSLKKWEFANFIESEYGIQLEHSEGSEIILANCVALMMKLQIPLPKMAEYFMEYII